MTNGEFCGDNGGKFLKHFVYKEKGATYHRRTQIFPSGRSVEWVKSSEIPWIAVKGKDYIYFVSCGKVQEIPDFSEIFRSGLNEPLAIVSRILGTGEVHDGSSFAVSFAEYNEKAAINFLNKILCAGTFMFDEVKTAISALQHLCSGNFKGHEIEIYVVDKDKKIKSLPRNLIEGLTSANTEHTCKSGNIGGSQETDVLCQEGEGESNDSLSLDDLSHERSRIRHNRETQIWHGGWDSRLSKTSGFSWICVQGKNSICVVTQEVMLGEKMLENAPSHMKDNQVFGKKVFLRKMSKKSFVMRPFAAVSVVVGFDEVHEGSGHEASSAEIKAIEFLMKKINKSSDFTFAGTVQTAISALLILTEKDLNPEEIKACVWRKGECLPAKSTKLGTKEIGDHLRVINSQALLTQGEESP